jgi:hypothetical protein
MTPPLLMNVGRADGSSSEPPEDRTSQRIELPFVPAGQPVRPVVLELRAR